MYNIMCAYIEKTAINNPTHNFSDGARHTAVTRYGARHTAAIHCRHTVAHCRSSSVPAASASRITSMQSPLGGG